MKWRSTQTEMTNLRPTPPDTRGYGRPCLSIMALLSTEFILTFAFFSTRYSIQRLPIWLVLCEIHPFSGTMSSEVLFSLEDKELIGFKANPFYWNSICTLKWWDNPPSNPWVSKVSYIKKSGQSAGRIHNLLFVLLWKMLLRQMTLIPASRKKFF